MHVPHANEPDKLMMCAILETMLTAHEHEAPTSMLSSSAERSDSLP